MLFTGYAIEFGGADHIRLPNPTDAFTGNIANWAVDVSPPQLAVTVKLPGPVAVNVGGSLVESMARVLSLSDQVAP
jgi:hypothetical protein